MQEYINRYLKRTGFGTFHPKAVLFDMDGVLINSMPNHAVAWQRSMATFGIRMTAADAYATEGARGIDTIRAMVKAQQGKDITLEEKNHYGLRCAARQAQSRPLSDGDGALRDATLGNDCCGKCSSWHTSRQCRQGVHLRSEHRTIARRPALGSWSRLCAAIHE